ncbi:MAG: NAD-dependent epimerase/dehydratase family protein [Bacteriovoracaceae bacterium]|nr:NAD-dependent epimerase/dehydratase family protein [Bacteriovoracaceae bacterium]
MKVLVTGAGGFLGTHIAKKLIDQGHQVINLSRGNYPHLEKMGIKSFKADLQNHNEIEVALDNVDAVIHTASKVAMWGKWEDFQKINVEGTKNLVNLCKKKGIKYFVNTSSPSVVFGDESLEGVDETVDYPSTYYSRYAKSKAESEKWVLEQASETFKVVSLRPHLIYGPGDKNLFPRLIEAAKKGKLKRVGDGKNKVDVIYVENAAIAHLNALDKLKTDNSINGRAYFLGQERPVILWDFINEILDRAKAPRPKKNISFNKAYKIGNVIEKSLEFLSIYNVHPPMTRFVALQLSKSHWFNHSNAEKDLGFKPTFTIEEGLDLTLN